jgi:hypothetical protein
VNDRRSPEDIEAEARRLIAHAESSGVLLRLIGGLAIRVHSPGQRLGDGRTYRDVDVVTASSLREVDPVFQSLGYDPFTRFNALHGHSRAIFYGRGDRLKVDVFLGSFSMCHDLPLQDRLTIDPLTVPLAELLLTKLQIVRLTEKDLLDLCALIAEHPVRDDDADAINGVRVAEICARDWGLYHTVELGLDRLLAELDAGRVRASDPEMIRGRLDELRRRMQDHAKTRKWRMRARVGERLQWYEEPDEVVDAS